MGRRHEVVQRWPRSAVLVAAVSAAAAILSSELVSVTAGVPQFMGGAQHDGATGPAPLGGVMQQWFTALTLDERDHHAVLSEVTGRLLVGTGSGMIALDAATGAQLAVDAHYSLPPVPKRAYTPALSPSGLIAYYPGTLPGDLLNCTRLIAATLPLMTHLWTAQLPGVANTNPVVLDSGVVLVGTTNGSIQAVRTDGALALQYATFQAAAFAATPAVSSDSGLLIVPGATDLYAYNLTSYAPDAGPPALVQSALWNITISGGLTSGAVSISRDGTYAYITSDAGAVAAVFVANGTLANTANGASGPTPTTDDSRVYIVAGSSMYALSTALTGVAVWGRSLPGLCQSSPAVTANGAVLVTCSDGMLRALHAANGSEAWGYAVGATSTRNPPIVGANGYVYALGTGSGVTALRFIGPLPSLSMTPVVTQTASQTGTTTGTASRTPLRTPTTSIIPSDAPTASPSATPTSSMTPSVTPAGTELGTRGATPWSTPSPTLSVSPTSRPTESPSASATVTPTWTPTGTPVPSITGATLTVMPNVTSGDLDGVLVVVGNGLVSVCDSTRSVWTSWTRAPLASLACNSTTATARYNASADVGTWLWYGGALESVPAGGGPVKVAPDTTAFPAVITSSDAAGCVWGATITIASRGLGIAQVTDIVLFAVSVRTSADVFVPCANVTAAGPDAVTCTLRFITNALVGSTPEAHLVFGTFGTASAGSLPTPVVAPRLLAWDPHALLSRGGGSPVTALLPVPDWSTEELAVVTSSAWGESATLPISIVLQHVGSGDQFVADACTVVGGARAELTCPTPPGHGWRVRATLVLHGLLNLTLLTNGSVLTAAYSPPDPTAVTPDYVLLPPATGNASLLDLVVTFDAAADLPDIASLAVAGRRCPSVATQLGVPTVVCQNWDAHAAAVAAGHGVADMLTLTVTVEWNGAAFTSGALGTIVVRPTLTSVSPTRVSSGGMLILFGANFCPPTGCVASASDSQLDIGVQGATHYTCTAVTVVSSTAATCTVPPVAADDAAFPNFNVTLANSEGAVAAASHTIIYPSSGFVYTLTPPPTTFIPSDATVPWPVPGAITVGVRTVGVVAAVTNISCSLTSATAGVLLIPLDRGSLLSIRGAESVAFGAFAIQSSFSLASVTLEAACTADGGSLGSLMSASVTLAVTPLRATLCTAPPAAARSQVALPPWSVALTVAGGAPPSCDANGTWPGAPLPPVTCTVTASSADGVRPSLVASSADVLTASGVATWDALSVGGSVDSHVDLVARCTIGSLVIPPVITATLAITGCAPGAQPSGPVCSPCSSTQNSNGGADTCHGCPSMGAQCSAGVLRLQPGFFRPPSQASMTLDATSELHACGLPAGCAVNDSARTYTCVMGYSGALCGVCDAERDYSRIGDVCVRCLPQAANKALLVAGVVLLLLGVGFFVLRSSARKKKSPRSIALRILLSHVQALGALRTFKASGTVLYKQVMAWVDVLSPAIVSQGPAQCVMRPAYLSTFFATLSAPLIAAGAGIVIMVVAAAVGACRPQGDTRPCGVRAASRLAARWHERRPLAILLFVSHLAYMPITTACIEVFKCTEAVDGTRYLVADLRLSCRDPTYVLAATVAAGVLVVYGLGFPALLYGMLSRASPATLSNTNFNHAWGFLYDGYRFPALAAAPDVPSPVGLQPSPYPDTPTPAATPLVRGAVNVAPSSPGSPSSLLVRSPLATPRKVRRNNAVVEYLVADKTSLAHWEATVLLRKAGIVLIATLIASPLTQVAAVNLMTVMFLAAHTRVLPYASPYFNVADGLSMVTVIATATLCIMSTEAGASPTSASYLGITAVMLLLNMAVMALFVSSFCWFALGPVVAARRAARARRMLNAKAASIAATGTGTGPGSGPGSGAAAAAAAEPRLSGVAEGGKTMGTNKSSRVLVYKSPSARRFTSTYATSASAPDASLSSFNPLHAASPPEGASAPV